MGACPSAEAVAVPHEEHHQEHDRVPHDVPHRQDGSSGHGQQRTSGAMARFNEFLDESRPRSLRVQAAFDAMEGFKAARRKAPLGSDAWLAATKNLGSVALRLAKFQGFQDRSDHDGVCRTLTRARTEFARALRAGASTRDRGWMTKTEALATETATAAHRYLVDNIDGWRARVGKLEKGLDIAGNDDEAAAFCRSAVNVEIVKELLTAAARLVDAADPELKKKKAGDGATGTSSHGPVGAELVAELQTMLVVSGDEEHEGVMCDRCGASPIVGTRFWCLTRHDGDLCATCMAREHSSSSRKTSRDVYLGVASRQPVAVWSAIKEAAARRAQVEVESSQHWKQGLAAIEDCRRPLTELGQLSRRFPRARLPPTEDLRIEHATLYKRLECQKLIDTARDHLANSLFENECLDVGGVWLVLDTLMSAVQAAQREPASAIEEEAIATAKIGVIYASVLKDDTHAGRYLYQAMRLVDCITHADGRTFFNAPWYQEAKTALQELQRKREERDDAVVKSQRAKALAKLKPQLDALSASVGTSPKPLHDRVLHLAQHLVKHHPPKKEADAKKLKAKVDAFDPKGDKDKYTTALKRLLSREAAAAYHPDKNKDYGVEWCVLCDEIIRHINSLSLSMKEAS